MAEFDAIQRLRDIVCGSMTDRNFEPVIGIGDDGAVLAVPAGRQLVVATDTLVEGIHFFAGISPRDLGHKSLAVNLSDLAAMGAEPAWFFLALTLPRLDDEWLEEFAAGLAALADESGVILAGGDTTSGPLSVTITVLGWVDEGMALTRSGARQGDRIVISGCPGEAALALRILSRGDAPPARLHRRLLRPEPRLAVAGYLRGLATSCIDVSDGLVADLGHILSASGKGAELQLADLPATPELQSLPENDRFDLQLTGGDDYELCFTVPPERIAALDRIRRETGVALSVIGRVDGSGRIRCIGSDGNEFRPAGRSYQHFDPEGVPPP